MDSAIRRVPSGVPQGSLPPYEIGFVCRVNCGVELAALRESEWRECKTSNKSNREASRARLSVPKLYPNGAVRAVPASGAVRRISKLRAFSTPTGFKSHPRLQTS